MVKCNKCGYVGGHEGYMHMGTPEKPCGGTTQAFKEDRHTRLKCSGCNLLVNAKFGIELMGGPHGCGGTWEPYAGQGVPYSEAAALDDDVADGPVVSFARRVAKAGGHQAGVTYCNKCGGTMKEDGAHNCQAAAMSAQAAMQRQSLMSQVGNTGIGAQAAWNQMQANQQQYQDSPTMVLSGLKKHISELETVVRARDERIKEQELCLAAQKSVIVDSDRRINQLETAVHERTCVIDNDMQRANRLSDECGTLKTENTLLLAENARLRRGWR